jgi:hypothetical protein
MLFDVVYNLGCHVILHVGRLLPGRRLGIAHYRDGRDSRFADAGGIAERVAFCRYN